MIRVLSTRRRIDRRRSARLATVAVVAVVAFVAMSCGESDDTAGPAGDTTTTLVGVGNDSTTTTAAEPTATTAPVTTPTTQLLTLEERIVANMQGAQSEYQDAFGDSGPGIVFFHRGTWASEAFEWPLGSGFCERATFTWSVVDATSESEFTIVYDELTEDPDCVALEGTRFTAIFSGPQEVDGRTVYDLAYADEQGNQLFTGTRTVCSDQWNDPEPCGLTLAGFEMSTPPQS